MLAQDKDKRRRPRSERAYRGALVMLLVPLAACEVYDPMMLVTSEGGMDAAMDATSPEAGMEAGTDAGRDADLDAGTDLELCNGLDDDDDERIDEGPRPRQNCVERFTHVTEALCEDGDCLRSEYEACEPGWCDCTGRGLISDCNTPYAERGTSCYCGPKPPVLDAGPDAGADAGSDAGADASLDAAL